MNIRKALVGAALGLPVVTQATAGVQISVPVGAPTQVHHLKYEVMYSEKPFEHASIYYYDNGIYKIVSPGEDHYGVYLVEGRLTDPAYKISYLSLPSDDWGGNVAKHDLKFDSQAQRFEQQALTHSDQNIPLQHGSFTQESNDITDPSSIRWLAP